MTAPPAAQVLRWRSHPHMDGTIAAVGARGQYTISRVGDAWWLEGIWHDGLPIWDAPAKFVMQEHARAEAERVDQSVLEAIVGGE